MTRINIIEPNELTDQHLIAEFREIFMVGGSLNRTLNSGHVYFFYNKGKYLHRRYQELITEMKRRGFKPDNTRVFPTSVFKDNGLYNDWTPNIEDYKIIRERIQQNIDMKPNWYRKTEYASK